MPTNILTNMRLYNKIIPGLSIALENTYRRLYEELLIPIINEKVYLAGTPQYYEREHEIGSFYQAFFYTTVQQNLNSISARIGYDPTGFENDKANTDWEPLSYDPFPPDESAGKKTGFVHGSVYTSQEEEITTDSRKNLADMIELGAPAIGGLFKGNGYWTEPRPFWSTFLEEVSWRLQEIFEEECQKINLNVGRRKARFAGGIVSSEPGNWKVSGGMSDGGEDY